MMANDRYSIDGNKIDHHPDRVKQWLEAGGDWEKAKKVYPIYVEISPAGACNHRCTFCSVDYIGYVNRSIDSDVLMGALTVMGEKGVRSVMYAGEGEPLLHKDLSRIIKHSSDSGIDSSITTNAIALTEKFAYEALPYTSWIKASINAGTAESYGKIHQTNAKDFDRAFGNMERAARVREELELDHDEHTLGAQMVLLPENAPDAVAFAKRAKDSGLDYAVLKPYSQQTAGISRKYEGLTYGDFMGLEDELKSLDTDSFQVIFRKKTMAELERDAPSYTVCPSTPFMWGYIMASGDVFGCSAYLDDDRFQYGNINDSSFQDIWEGERRHTNMEYVLNELDVSECRVNCRMNSVNQRLDNLLHSDSPLLEIGSIDTSNPPKHKNFI